MPESLPTPQEQLTAYALNELNASERARIDAQLKNDSTAQAYVNDVRATAALLETELKKERLDDLARAFGAVGVAQPAAAQPAPAKIAPLAPPSTWRRYAIYGTAAAALVVFGILIWNGQTGSQKSGAPVANAELKEKAMSNIAQKQPENLVPVPSPQSESAKETAVKTERQNAQVPHEEDGAKITEIIRDTSDKSKKNEPVGLKTISGATIGVETPRAGTTRTEKNFNLPAIVKNASDSTTPKNPDSKLTTPLPPPNISVVPPKVPAEITPAEMNELRKKMNSMETPPTEDSRMRAHSLSGLKLSDKNAEVVPDPNNWKCANDGDAKVADNKPSSKYDGGKNRDPNEFGKNDSAANKVATPPSDVLKVLPPPTNSPPAMPVMSDVDHALTGGNKTPMPVQVVPSKNGAKPNEDSQFQAFDVHTDKAMPPTIQRPVIDQTDPNNVADISSGKPRGGRGNFGKKNDNQEPDATPPPALERTKKEAQEPDSRFGKLDPNEEAAKTKPSERGRNHFGIPEDEGFYKSPRDKKPDPNYPESVTITPPDVNGTYTPPTTGEAYNIYPENRFESVRNAPLSTFSADVDTASFSNVRRFLTGGRLPPPEAVRVEELINYFKYNYDVLKSEDPFGVNVEAAACPWNSAHRLVRVAIKASGLAANQRPASNLVFLIDVSGSMDDPKRLPLVKEGMKALVRRLNENDRVAIVTYAGQSGIALQSTSCSEKDRIIGVIDALHAEGETNGGAGIQTAYATAKANFIKGGVNRVILATDGDFNVGVTSPDALVKMIEAETPSGVFLTALGYGMGNLKDAMLQRLADKGNGHYAYIDNADESRKVLIEQMNATLVAVAKDVKFQVEFNPAQAEWYRLIGYEKRALGAQDFNNDAKGAGEIGAGHSVTAFYEVVTTQGAPVPGVDPLKYQDQPKRVEAPATKPETASSELLTLKIRYKQPEGDTSKRLEFAFTDRGATMEQATSDFKFGASVALFGQILRHSRYVQSATMRQAVELADDNRGVDEGGYRREFIQLARKAGELRGER